MMKNRTNVWNDETPRTERTFEMDSQQKQTYLWNFEMQKIKWVLKWSKIEQKILWNKTKQRKTLKEQTKYTLEKSYQRNLNLQKHHNCFEMIPKSYQNRAKITRKQRRNKGTYSTIDVLFWIYTTERNFKAIFLIILKLIHWILLTI